jgi:hypothetical protein
MQVFAPNSEAQVRVTAIWKDGQSFERTNDVICRRDNWTEEGIYLEMVLRPFDQLTSPSGLVYIELTAPNGSIFKGSDKLGVMLLPPSDKDMIINVFSGNGEMQSSVGGVMTSGEVGIVVVKTEYAVRVRHTREGTVREFMTLEGEVVVDPPGVAPRGTLTTSGRTTLPTGKKVVFDSNVFVPARVTNINSEDIAKSASIYAAIDTAKAVKRSNVDPERTYENLLHRYSTVFEDPKNPDKRIQLAIDQVSLNITYDAIYQLNKAEQMTPVAQRSTRAVIAVAKGAAYSQAGNPAAAQTEVQKARTLDPSVLEEEKLRTYRFNDKMRQEVLQYKPRPIRLGRAELIRFTWPIPANLSPPQQQVFSLIREGNFVTASRLSGAVQRSRRLSSIDAYASAIIYYESKDLRNANRAASYALKQSMSDKLLSRETQDAATRILQLTRQQ